MDVVHDKPKKGPKRILPKGLYFFLTQPWAWLEKTTHIPSLNVLTILYEFLLLLFIVAGITKIKPNESEKKFVKTFLRAFIGGDNVFINKSNIKHLEKFGIKWGIRLGAAYWIGVKVLNPILHKTHVYEKFIKFFLKYHELHGAAKALLKLMEDNLYNAFNKFLLRSLQLSKQDREMLSSTIYEKNDKQNKAGIDIREIIQPSPDFKSDELSDKIIWKTSYNITTQKSIISDINLFMKIAEEQLNELQTIRTLIKQSKNKEI